jgi:hypothetical protein
MSGHHGEPGGAALLTVRTPRARAEDLCARINGALAEGVAVVRTALVYADGNATRPLACSRDA